MIRLGKDKIDERYNISDEGIITDLNGNAQRLRVDTRVWFKGVGVHKILMWTRYGWRDGKVWNVHHIDENKLNNSLSNLIFMTVKEHTSLHMKGKKLSEETKKKIAKSKKGIPMSENAKRKISETIKGHYGYMNGKKHSEETRKKMAESAKGHIVTEEMKKKISDANKKHWKERKENKNV